MQDEVSRLVAILEQRLGAKVPAKRPDLRLVESPPPPRRRTLDAITRESHLRMIRHLRRRWSLELLVDQATFGRGSLDQLEDDEIVRLHDDMHRAFECTRDGISLEEAGLIRQCGT